MRYFKLFYESEGHEANKYGEIKVVNFWEGQLNHGYKTMI